jgi:hypothetical protein
MGFNVRSFGSKETRTSFSFEKLTLLPSFGNGPRVFKFELPCTLAIAQHIKSKHES